MSKLLVPKRSGMNFPRPHSIPPSLQLYSQSTLCTSCLLSCLLSCFKSVFTRRQAGIKNCFRFCTTIQKTEKALLMHVWITETATKLLQIHRCLVMLLPPCVLFFPELQEIFGTLSVFHVRARKTRPPNTGHLWKHTSTPLEVCYGLNTHSHTPHIHTHFHCNLSHWGRWLLKAWLEESDTGVWPIRWHISFLSLYAQFLCVCVIVCACACMMTSKQLTCVRAWLCVSCVKKSDIFYSLEFTSTYYRCFSCTGDRKSVV